MNEIFPVFGGLLVGLVCSLIRSPRRRAWVLTGLSLAVGYLATVISGEYRVSWSFLCVDVPLVAGSALATLILVWAARLARPTT